MAKEQIPAHNDNNVKSLGKPRGNKKYQNKKKNPKCYNSVSCILSVALIVFILGSIVWDNFVTKPKIQREINEIKTEIKNINMKLLDENDISTAENEIFAFETIEKEKQND